MQNRLQAIEAMCAAICSILLECKPSIYLYGSCVLNDFQLGWSDIDVLILTERQISETKAMTLVNLRQNMLDKDPQNLYYRSLEGAALTLDSFLSHAPDRVVYWGTSGERITDHYDLDSFGMAQLTRNGVLLAGKDVRNRLMFPTFAELHADVKRHYDTIRTHARTTGRSLYSFGWMLDIARCIYTLRTGNIIAKTTAGEWALENGLCPDPEAMQIALYARRNPREPHVLDDAERMADPIQRFADVLEREL